MRCVPFGVAQMDNGEILLLASAENPSEFRPVVAISADRGETWSAFRQVRRM